MPIFRGFLLGTGLAFLVRRIAFTRPALAISTAAVATLAMEASVFALGYASARADCQNSAMRAQLISETVGGQGEAQCDSLAEHYRERHKGSFLSMPARVAVDLFQVLVAMLAAAALVRARATEPCCEHCGRWLVEKPLGATKLGIADALRRHLLGGDLEDAVQMLAPPDTREETRLVLASCPRHSSQRVLRIREERIERMQRSLRTRHHSDLSINGAEYDALRGALQ
jgi:hypothetical protein